MLFLEFVLQNQPSRDNHTNSLLFLNSTPTSLLLPPLPPPLHQIVFLLQINKHYQRVADYGLVEAASVC